MSERVPPSVEQHKRARFALGRVLRDFPIGPVPALVIAVAILALWTVLALVLWQSRQAELGRARSTVDNLTRLLDEQTYRVFQTSDLALTHLTERLEQTPRLPPNDPGFRSYMRSTVAGLPHLRALFVIGPGGFIMHDTDYPETPRVSLADRGYFIVHELDPHVGLHVGQPIRSRSVGTWFVPLSRRLDNLDGSLAGVAVAAVEQRFFEDFYNELKLGPNDAVALFNLNTMLIARVPEMPEIVGQTWPDIDLFKELRRGQRRGNFAIRSFSGVDSLAGYSRIAGYPLVASVALSIPDVLASWRRYAIITVASLVCVTLLILVMLFLVMQRHRERAIARQNAMHFQKMQALGRMTGSVAHDFGNILAVVSSSVSLMRKKGATEQLLDAGEQAIARGTLLTRQLLSFVKRQELNLRPENLDELLGSLEPMIRHAVGDGVNVALELAADGPPCLVDHAQFDAAIMNLVINAAHAMPEGGDLLISTEARTLRDHKRLAPGEYVSVRVKDTGCGISPAELQHIFEPFFTTKKDHGTGLGLSQVYEFIKQVGGDVVVESTVGRGTTIRLLFPRVGEEARATA